MIKKIGILSLLVAIFVGSHISAQLKKGALVDGITAVIGNEIVLESDIDEQMNYAKQQGIKVDNKCEFLGNLVSNKLIIYQAKKDTLINIRKEAIEQQVEGKYSEILSQFPDEKTMVKMYGFRTPYEMKNAIKKIDTDNQYRQEKYGRIVAGIDITPNEVTDFYNMYKFELPEVKDEVRLARIMIYPKLKDSHKQEIIDKLKKIKKQIEGGESFEKMATIYSEDPGSASKGGLYKNIAKGQMVKSFEATALNLQEGEISDPIESEFGYHIIQLVKKSGKNYDARHILISAEPTREEIAEAKKELDSIRTLIKDGKMTFKEASFRFSDDKSTKFNSGIITIQGEDRLEKYDLPATLGYQIAGLNKGDMTDVFEDENNKRKTLNIVLINDIIPAHQLDINTDYERIKTMALNKKQSEVVDKWVKEQLPNVFMSINKRYKDCDLADWQKKAIEK